MKAKAKAFAHAATVSLLIGSSGCIAEPVEEAYGEGLDEVSETSEALQAVGWMCSWECRIDVGTYSTEDSGCASGLHAKETDAVSSIENDADACSSSYVVQSVSCSASAICTSAAGS